MILKENSQVKHMCECGCEVQKGGLAEHRKTEKHQKLIANLANTIITE